MNETFNTDYKKAAEKLEAFCQELSLEKLQIAAKLKSARSKIEDLELEIEKLKAALESI